MPQVSNKAVIWEFKEGRCYFQYKSGSILEEVDLKMTQVCVGVLICLPQRNTQEQK